MAWSQATLYEGPNWVVIEVTAGAAGDIELTLTHDLGEIPIGTAFVAKNAAGGGAAWWTDDETTTTVDIHKPAGAPGAHAHVHIFTLRHPH